MTEVKRYHPHHPHIDDRDVVLASAYDALVKTLADPEAVLANMMRGTIAKPSLRSMLTLFGEVFNTEEAANIEIATLRARLQELEGQKPVAYCSPDSLLRLKAKQFDGMMVYTDGRDTPCTVALYASPVAGLADPSMALPCEIKLPGGMTIGKGCRLSTLLLAFRNRTDAEPWRQRFSVPVPFDPALMNIRSLVSAQADHLPTGIDSEGGTHD